ncbi:DNA polymerase I [Candidatus Saccharibacteria bacterium]|nr:DNA polymerase I [Candidatus Saccharibacteria bacterium]
MNTLAEAANKKLVLIDGKSVFYRGYYAMPNLSTKDGTPTGGVYGFAMLSLEVIKRLKPDYVAVAWDKPKTNIRKRLEIYPEYKAGRKPAPPDFYVQIPILHELLESLGWPLYELDDYEADDIMAGFAKKADKLGLETILITSDLDALQCISDHTKVFALKNGLSNIEEFHPESFTAKYGLRPDQFLDLKALQGDSSDNIPGVAGVGAKTASALLQKYETIDGIYENIELISGSAHDKLLAGKESAYMSKKLATLFLDAPLELDLDAMDVHKFDGVRLRQNLEKLEFRAILRTLGDLPINNNQPSTPNLSPKGNLSLPDLVAVEKFKPADNLFIHVVTKDSFGRQPIAIILANDTQVTFVENFKDKTNLANIISGKNLIGYDLKKVLKTLHYLGIKKGVAKHDIQITNFLIDSLDKVKSLSDLAEKQVGYGLADLDNLPPEDLGLHVAEVAGVIKNIYIKQANELKSMPSLSKLSNDIEMPIIPILANMEIAGIGLDTGYLNDMGRYLEDEISDIEQTIYGYAEQEFNISSPQQLADILFDVLGLPTIGIKKGKTGYSTASNELDKLRPYHPIIDCITNYREYTKLKSTYVDTLPQQVAEDGRVHTTFNITVAQTGRLSSADPNLQNIPVRTELGRKIRTAFVAGEGNVFVSADYSQFELRLAAVMAGDTDMIEVFNNGEDIHTRTAAEVYGVALDDVTKQMRSAAKTINFGVLYGMSPHGLSVATGMTMGDAKNFIDRYFATRQPLVDYIFKLKEEARDKGYVETLFGRRRPTPDVHSPNYIVRSSAERQAVNMPIQGTEADLMKKAMIQLEKVLPTEAKQLLQIHDSILVECPKNQADKVAEIMKDIMENVAPEIPIKLSVDVHIAQNWGEL